METAASLGRAFDRLAPAYDVQIESNPIHALLRSQSLAWLDEAFHPKMHVLEIGCGVGTEAIHLARRGVRVTATDLSEGMVAVARARIRDEGLSERIDVRQCAAAELATRFGEGSFDGAYASLGPLNGEKNLPDVIRNIATLLKPGASFLTSVVSRPCLPELATAVGHMAFAKAFRRLRSETEIDLAGNEIVTVHAYSEGDVRKALVPAFRIVRLQGLLVALPPPYLAGPWGRLEPLHAPAEWWDVRLRGRWPFRGWGDHLHVWAEKRDL